MRIKKVEVKYGLNQGLKLPTKIFKNELLRKAHNRFFGYMDVNTQEQQTQCLGNILDYIFDSGINDYNLKVVNYFIKRLMDEKSLTNNKVELANIFYSSSIKRITAEDIVKGNLSPMLYVNFVKEGIKNYYRHPVGKEIDYRHIAGRMLNWKNLASSMPKALLGFDKNFNCLQWDETRQADFLGVLERILTYYDSLEESFKLTKGSMKLRQEGVVSTYEEHQQKFLNNIPKLLELTLGKVRTLMNNPKKNKNEIEDKLEIAYYYYDKIPYDSPLMPKLTKIFAALREQEKILANRVRTKHA